MIVVGSRNSSNSVRLVEVALEAGAKASYLVDDAHRDRRGLARRRRHRLGDLRRLGAGGPGRGRARVPLRARLPRRPRRPLGRGVADLRAAARAAPRHAAAAPEQGLARWPATSTSTPTTRSRGWSPRSSRRCATTQLIAYPTDSGYALGAQLGNRDGRDRILRDPRARRPPPLHADVQGLLPARPVRPRRQRRVPRDQGGDAGAVHLHPARDRRGAEAADAPQEAHRRRADPRPHAGLRAARGARRADPHQHADPARRDRGADHGLGDQGGPRPRGRHRRSSPARSPPSRPR